MTDKKQLPDRAALLAQVDALLHKETFSKEDSAKAEALIRLANAITPRDELWVRSLFQLSVMAVAHALGGPATAKTAGSYFDDNYTAREELGLAGKPK